MSGGPCYLYSSVTAIKALHALGGLAGLRARPSIRVTHAISGEKRHSMIRLEDDEHRRKIMREAMERVCRLPLKELMSAPIRRAVAVGS